MGKIAAEARPARMRLPRAFLVALLVLGFDATDGAAVPTPAAAAPSPRLVLLYATCSLHKLHLSPYDASVDYTPNLKRFAGRALTFERHHTEVAQSGSAYATLFTGTQAMHHRVLAHPRRLGEESDSITEIFARAGWEVHSWLAHPMANAQLGYAQGVPEAHRHLGLFAGDAAEFNALLERMRTDRGLKALVVANFTVTHTPYEGHDLESFCAQHPSRCAPFEDRSRFTADRRAHTGLSRALSFDYEATVARLGWDAAEQERFRASVELLYQADVAHLDSLFGGVIDAIGDAGLEEEALVVFTADHGETLFRADAPFKWTHGFQLVPDELEVPLLVRGPGIAPGRYPALTRSIDVLPTMASLSGVTLPDHLARRGSADTNDVGRDLREAIRGEEPAPELTAFVHTGLVLKPHWRQFENFGTLASYFPHSSPASMWLGSRKGDLFFQLRRKPGEIFTFALFDLKADPPMKRNLFHERDPQHAAAREGLLSYRERLLDAARARQEPIPGDAEQRLRALGYIE